MTPPAENRVTAFLETVERSRLLAPPVDGIVAVQGDTPERLAAELVGSGRLTRFQAEKLLHGRWQGLVVGPYRLMCPLGRGGVGIVYLARDDRRPSGGATPRLLALKVLSPKRARDEPRTLARFQREMDIGSSIPPHPHLARTWAAGVSDGIHYIGMEYVPGQTAKQLVVESGPMPVSLAARVFADVAAGLHAAHATGFVHRDTKPSNVIVTPAGRGKLLDFGFALRRGERADADPTVIGGKGYTLGTADYLPPEQASNAVAVGAETDVYSLGCSLYFVLTGQTPFPGGSTQDKIRAHRTAEPQPIVSFNPSVPREVVGLVSWLMAKRPENRPQSAAVVTNELERWAKPAVYVATPASYGDDWERATLAAVEARWKAIPGVSGEEPTSRS